jgi:hypothetical protein
MRDAGTIGIIQPVNVSRMACLSVAAIASVMACSDDAPPPAPAPLAPTEPAPLLDTLNALAVFGEKRAGSEAGAAAARYIEGRFQAMGLPVTQEEFHFPRWTLASSALSIDVDGAPWTPAFDVFDASGSGHVEATVVDVGTAHPADFEGKDVAGKICLVARDPSYHRTAQIANVAERGGAAVIYRSSARGNLRQVGTVRQNWEAQVSIPVVTIGAEDGATLQARAGATAIVDVQAASTPASGHNLVARLAGTDPAAGTLVIGAHFDTWFTGSTDNGGGVAALLALAERRTKRPKTPISIWFVAYDGEEIGLYGGYDFLRRHVVAHENDFLATLHFETPSAKERSGATFGHSVVQDFDEILRDAELDKLYGGYVNMSLVPALFGGTIPTDVRGLYRGGIPTALASVSSPYYHTQEDTPDKVDLEFLAQAVDGFDSAVSGLALAGRSCCDESDPHVWRATTSSLTAPDGSLVIDVRATDAAGAPQAQAKVEAQLLYDDFFLAGTANGLTDADGRARLMFPPEQAAKKSGRTYVQVTAGQLYPLVEAVLSLP